PERGLDLLVVEPRVAARDDHHVAIAHLQRQGLGDLRGLDVPGGGHRRGLAVELQPDDLHVRGTLGEERAYGFRAHAATAVRSTPTSSISTSITSPLATAWVWPGVPVKITSPGSSVT